MSFWEVMILAVVEGLTEFLPVSSTGHLIAASFLMGIPESEFSHAFDIIIQSGAIFSVLVLYWRRFFPIRLDFYLKLFIAFLPAAVIGLLVKKKIDILLGNVTVVASTLVLGGVVLIVVDRYLNKEKNGKEILGLSVKDCLLIGLAQCLAFVPGVSRSAATILGGMAVGMARKEAAEFSFFLAVPTLLGAAAVKLGGAVEHVNSDQWGQLAWGVFLSFVVAILSMRFFIAMVQRFGFRHFGWYRIAAGLFLFACLMSGAQL